MHNLWQGLNLRRGWEITFSSTQNLPVRVYYKAFLPPLPAAQIQLMLQNGSGLFSLSQHQKVLKCILTAQRDFLIPVALVGKEDGFPSVLSNLTEDGQCQGLRGRTGWAYILAGPRNLPKLSDLQCLHLDHRRDDGIFPKGLLWEIIHQASSTDSGME